MIVDFKLSAVSFLAAVIINIQIPLQYDNLFSLTTSDVPSLPVYSKVIEALLLLVLSSKNRLTW